MSQPDLDTAIQGLDKLIDDPENEETVEAAVVESVEPPEVVEETETPAEEPSLLAGKYKSPEELEKAYLDAQRKIGEQGNELGELRSWRTDVEKQISEIQSQQTPPPPPGTSDWLNEESFSDPRKARNAVIYALNYAPHQFEDAMEMWFDVHPRAASAFEMEMLRSEFETQLNSKVAPLEEVPKRLEADDAQKRNEQNFNAALKSVLDANPGLEDLAPQIVEESQNVPVYQKILVDPEASVDDKAAVLNNLLLVAQHRRVEAEQKAQAEAEQEATTAKTKARVVTATSTAGRRATGNLSQKDKILEIFDSAAAKGFYETD